MLGGIGSYKSSSHDPAALTRGSLLLHSYPLLLILSAEIIFFGVIKNSCWYVGLSESTAAGGATLASHRGWCGHSAVVSCFCVSLCIPQAGIRRVSHLGESEWTPFYRKAFSPCPSACPTRHHPPLHSRAAAFCSCIVTPAVFLLCIGKRCSDVRSADRIAWLLMSPMIFQ